MNKPKSFPHRIDFATDLRVLEMISTWGFQGYGWYWRILEMMAHQEGYFIAIESKSFEELAEILKSTESEIKGFISDCVDEFKDERTGEGLLAISSDRDCIWSWDLRDCMHKANGIKQMRVTFGKAGAKKRWKKKRKKILKSFDIKKKKTNIKIA